MAIYHQFRSRLAGNSPASDKNINTEIETGFLEQYQRDDIRKTHLFEGRYENIYLDENHIPQLKAVIEEATERAAQVLQEDGIDVSKLRAGYWFNYMPPGATTTLHTHDDDDELLSCVYYVIVPENSGNLIIYDGEKKIEIDSQTGDFVFFKPDVRHEVSRNNSTEHRLSIGMNFGTAETYPADDD